MSAWTPFWASFLPAALLAWPIWRLLLAMRSRQTIDPYAPDTHQAKQGTPTMGGLIVLVGVVSGLLCERFRVPENRPVLDAVLVLFAGFAAIGFIDDFLVPRLTKKRGLGWLPKLAMQIGISGYIAVVQQGDLTRAAVAVFFILACANAFNFADGLDGLAAGIWLAMIPALVGTVSQNGWAVTLAITGGIIPFLFLNAPPAKVFMGDVGSLPIGATVGYLMLQPLQSGGGQAMAAVVFGLVLIAELVPVPLQVGFYKLTKKRLFPMTPIHHAFEKKGWVETRVVAAFVLAQLVFSLASVTLADMFP